MHVKDDCWCIDALHKLKVPVPSLTKVRLMVRGYAPEPTPEPNFQREEPPAPDAPPSPGAVLVMDLKRFAAVKALEAQRARGAFANVMAQHAGRKRRNEACWCALDRARPSTSYTVLEKLEQIEGIWYSDDL